MQVRLWGRCIPTVEQALLHPLASALSPSALLLSPSACSASSFSSSHTDILFLSNNTTVSIVFRINLLNICCNNFSFWHCLCLMCQVKDISFQVAIYLFLYLSISAAVKLVRERGSRGYAAHLTSIVIRLPAIATTNLIIFPATHNWQKFVKSRF